MMCSMYFVCVLLCFCFVWHDIYLSKTVSSCQGEVAWWKTGVSDFSLSPRQTSKTNLKIDALKSETRGRWCKWYAPTGGFAVVIGVIGDLSRGFVWIFSSGLQTAKGPGPNGPQVFRRWTVARKGCEWRRYCEAHNSLKDRGGFASLDCWSQHFRVGIWVWVKR